METTFWIGIFAYIMSSINPAIIISSAYYGRDVRDFGDGNAGATNLFLHFGKSAGIAALVFDIFKGFLPAFVSYEAGIPDILIATISLFSVLGHQYPLFHKFRGGTGIATTIGVLLFFDKNLLLISVTLSLLVTALSYTRNLMSKENFPVLETGEATGFIVIFAYALFCGTFALKIFVFSDIALIIIKRSKDISDFLSAKFFSNGKRY